MTGIAHRRRFTGIMILAATLASCSLAGCKVLTVEQDRALRARRGGKFDAQRYVREIWAARALPAIMAQAVPLDRLLPAIDAGLDTAGRSLGRRVGDGSAWTFVVRGRGRIAAIDQTSRQGRLSVSFAGIDDASPARLQIGPVVEGSAVRDALPFVAFDDFADQLVFADVGNALTARALAGVKPVLRTLRAGQEIDVVGVANVRRVDEPLVITPIAIAVNRDR